MPLKHYFPTILLFLISHLLLSQSLYVELNSKETLEFKLEGVKKLTYEDNQLVLYKKDKSAQSWPLSLIQKYYYTTSDDPLSITDTPQESLPSFTLFPNPAASNLTIRLNEFIEPVFLIEIYDQKSLRLMFFDKSFLKNKLDITWNCRDKNGLKLNPGLYFCKVYSGHNTYIKKFQIY